MSTLQIACWKFLPDHHDPLHEPSWFPFPHSHATWENSKLWTSNLFQSTFSEWMRRWLWTRKSGTWGFCMHPKFNQFRWLLHASEITLLRVEVGGHINSEAVFLKCTRCGPHSFYRHEGKWASKCYSLKLERLPSWRPCPAIIPIDSHARCRTFPEVLEESHWNKQLRWFPVQRWKCSVTDKI